MKNDVVIHFDYAKSPKVLKTIEDIEDTSVKRVATFFVSNRLIRPWKHPEGYYFYEILLPDGEEYVNVAKIFEGSVHKTGNVFIKYILSDRTSKRLRYFVFKYVRDIFSTSIRGFALGVKYAVLSVHKWFSKYPVNLICNKDALVKYRTALKECGPYLKQSVDVVPHNVRIPVHAKMVKYVITAFPEYHKYLITKYGVHTLPAWYVKEVLQYIHYVMKNFRRSKKL